LVASGLLVGQNRTRKGEKPTFLRCLEKKKGKVQKFDLSDQTDKGEKGLFPSLSGLPSTLVENWRTPILFMNYRGGWGEERKRLLQTLNRSEGKKKGGGPCTVED